MEVNHLRNEVLNAKKDLVAEIQEKVLGSESAILVEYHGLNVDQITELRANLHNEDVEFKVYKNTMFRRAVEGTDFEGLTENLTGPNAVAYGSDAVAPSRILAEFAKKNKKLKIKAGFVDGEIVELDEIKELATLPDYEGMLSMFLSVLQAPVRNLAYALSEVADKQEELGEETEETEVEEASEETEEKEETTETEAKEA